MKETVAQRVERIKREKDPFSILPDILRYAETGFDSIPDEDLNVRFRAWGLYTQGDGQGVRGKAVPRFMMRIRIPGGQLFAHQLHTIADLADRYGQGVADVTDRQNIQLHHIRIEDVPDIFAALHRVGLTTMGACGDNTRNITSCPLAGVDATEICDASPLVQAANRLLNGNPAYSNLPRKFKVTITGCRHWCTYPEINDVGLVAREREVGGRREVGFDLLVGGGLATAPHLAVRIPAFVRWHEAVRVVEAIAAIFRDSDVLRQRRDKARLKFLFLEYGWDAERMLAEIEARLGYPLEPPLPPLTPPEVHRDHVGIHPQRQPGMVYVGLATTTGRVTPAQLRAVADLAAEYGDGQIRLTPTQNIVILNVPSHRAAAVAERAAALGLPADASPFRRCTVSCTGAQFCKLAIVETKEFGAWLVAEMERRLPGFGEQVKLHVTGCPNSCGQHWIADIGLLGVKVKDGAQQVDGFEIFVGGGLGADPGFGRRTGLRVPAHRVPEALERILRRAQAERRPGESLKDVLRRTSDDALRTWVSSEPSTAD
ncbi:MAG: precorrin-3B synthase [Firmicutes bacterium]|nr:precorrin-3B synthase [Bacillota bacterium]